MKSIKIAYLCYLFPIILISCAFGNDDQEAIPGGGGDNEFLDNELGDEFSENINSDGGSQFVENDQFSQGQGGQFNQGGNNNFENNNNFNDNNNFDNDDNFDNNNNFDNENINAENNQNNFDNNNNFDSNQNIEPEVNIQEVEEPVVSQSNFSESGPINAVAENFDQAQQTNIAQGATDLEVTEIITEKEKTSPGRVKYVFSASSLYDRPDGKAISTLEKGDHPLVFDEGVWSRTSDGYYVPNRDMTDRPVGRRKRLTPWF